MAKPSSTHKRRFDLRKSPVDNQWRRWEQVQQGVLNKWDDTTIPGFKALIWVVTGVFPSRNAAFRDAETPTEVPAEAPAEDHTA
jgi:hypothetical protein